MGSDYGRLGAKKRIKAGKSPQPSYSIIDSQSVKTCYKGEERGIDGGKKIKGRKRHLVTDTLGNILKVKVHAANQSATIEGGHLFEEALSKYPSLEGVCADGGYRGTTANYVKETLKKAVTITINKTKEWIILAKRWIVERTFAWLNNSSRLAKDVEVTTSSSEAFIQIAHWHQILKFIT